MKKSFLLLTFITLLNCSKEKKVENTVFFGGQIINPSSDYVSLYKLDKRVDSLPLDKNNRFAKRYDSLDYGLFKMEHLPENQMVLIEAGDSIWARANMADFNSSLVFSGPGSAKNNFLMDIYLKTENERRFLSSKYALKSHEFRHIIDSLIEDKKQHWSSFTAEHTLSLRAQKLTQAAYIFPYANRMERYALIRGEEEVQKDSSYYAFRKFLNYGEGNLVYFEPYITYLMSYLSKEALLDKGSYFEQKGTTEFNIRRIQIIDDRISNPILRNTLARAVAYEELLNFKNHDQHESFLQYFLALNTSKAYLSEILRLHQSLIQMEPGRNLPEVPLENDEGLIVSSRNIFKNHPTVIYFWSQTQMNHFKRTQERVKKYQKEFPNYRFVGICIQPYNELVRDYQSIMRISPEDQYALVDFEAASSAWVITLLNKGIILNSEGMIQDGFTNFSANNFPQILSKFNP